MTCGLCGTDIQPGLLTCPSCQATYGPTLTPGLLAMFLPELLLLFAGFLETGEGLADKHNVKALIIGIVCIVAAAFNLWFILKKTPRGWRKAPSD